MMTTLSACVLCGKRSGQFVQMSSRGKETIYICYNCYERTEREVLAPDDNTKYVEWRDVLANSTPTKEAIAKACRVECMGCGHFFPDAHYLDADGYCYQCSQAQSNEC